MGEIAGGRLVVDALKREGVEYIFSLSGGHINPIYQACADCGIRVIDTRHEQAAAHMADAWGKLSRKPGVCVVTAGPGFTDALTGVANAYMSNSPMLIIAGRSGIRDADTLTLQELEGIDIIRPLVKWSRVVYETRRLDEYVAMAFRNAMTGRPGPVFLEIPVDVIAKRVDEKKVVRPEGYRPQFKPAGAPEAIEQAIAMLSSAQRPAIIASNGAYYADAGAELKEFAELTGAPVFTANLSRGLIPDDDPCYAGKVLGGGMGALGNCDLILVLGARFGMFLLHGRPPVIPFAAKVIQVDIEGSEIGRNRKVDLGIVGDVQEVLKGLIKSARGLNWSHHAWRDQVRSQSLNLEKSMIKAMPRKKDELHPLALMEEIDGFLDRDAIMVGDGGDTQFWAGMVRGVYRPAHYLDTGLFGCLGVGIPFGMSAKLMYPDKQVLVVMGDGSAGLNLMEFDTAVRHHLPIVMVICNDCSWGMIRHLQNALCTPEQKVGCELGRVSYEKIVEVLGGYGEMVERQEDLRPALERAFASKKPACLNVYVDRGPMSPASMMMGSLGLS